MANPYSKFSVSFNFFVLPFRLMILNRKGIPWYNGIDSFDTVSLQNCNWSWTQSFFRLSHHINEYTCKSILVSPYLPCRARTARTAHSPFFNHTEGFIYQDGRHLKTDCKWNEMADFFLETCSVVCLWQRVECVSFSNGK